MPEMAGVTAWAPARSTRGAAGVVPMETGLTLQRSEHNQTGYAYIHEGLTLQRSEHNQTGYAYIHPKRGLFSAIFRPWGGLGRPSTRIHGFATAKEAAVFVAKHTAGLHPLMPHGGELFDPQEAGEEEEAPAAEEETGEEAAAGSSHTPLPFGVYPFQPSKTSGTGYAHVTKSKDLSTFEVRIKDSSHNRYLGGFAAASDAALWVAKLVAGQNPPPPPKQGAASAAARPVTRAAAAPTLSLVSLPPNRRATKAATSVTASSSADGKVPPRRGGRAGTTPRAPRFRRAAKEAPLPSHGSDAEDCEGAWDGALCSAAAGEPGAGDAVEAEATPSAWAPPNKRAKQAASSATVSSSADGKAPPRHGGGAGTTSSVSRKRRAEEAPPLPGHGLDEVGFVGAWDGALCAVAAGEPLAGNAMETEAPPPPPGLWLTAVAAVAAAVGFIADAAPHAAPASPSSVEQRMRAQYTAAHRRFVEIPVVGQLDAPMDLPTVELARRVMACASSELHQDGLPEVLELLTEETDPAVTMARVSAGEWTSESGPMVTPASRREDFVGLGLVVPPWSGSSDVLSQPNLRLKKSAKLNVSDLENRGFNGTRSAAWILKQFDVPPKDRECLLNSIHPAASHEVQGCSGNTDALAQMPTALRDANISRRWWPNASVFLLISMQGTSMGYHLDLWATAVFYLVLWGQKMFVVAPPTPSNLRAFQAWQQGDERAGVGEFPAKLEGAKLLTLTQGQSLMLPSGWIHAVFTPEDSCVLGWNWQPKEQLPAMLSVVRADWGPKTEEMRQLKAFKFEELVRKLWDVLAEEVASLHEACHRPYGEEEAHDVGPIQRNVLGVLVSFLHTRTGMASSRDFKSSGADVLLSVAARLVVGGPEADAVGRCCDAFRGGAV